MIEISQINHDLILNFLMSKQIRTYRLIQGRIIHSGNSTAVSNHSYRLGQPFTKKKRKNSHQNETSTRTKNQVSSPRCSTTRQHRPSSTGTQRRSSRRDKHPPPPHHRPPTPPSPSPPAFGTCQPSAAWVGVSASTGRMRSATSTKELLRPA